MAAVEGPATNRRRPRKRAIAQPAAMVAIAQAGCSRAERSRLTARFPDAAASIAKSGVDRHKDEKIILRQGLAEQLDAKRMFGRDEPFDTIFFSYCLSMIPTWPGAIDAAMANLRPGGHLLIVDFWDQKDLPGIFAAGLKRWLAMFHVHYRPEVHDAIVDLGTSGRGTVEFESVARRYAYIASIQKN
ncbi:MAG: class I SAM-dependent methyltransferase [Verrucomicrobiota bacterium]